MGKFNWQNGTLVTPARVEINGEVHDVTPEQYSGQTPLSAENLNEMQDKIYEDIGNLDELSTNNKSSLVNAINEVLEKSYAIGYTSSNQGIYMANNLTFNINQSEIVGSYFEFDESNHCIKVLKDCVAILSGALFVDGTEGDDYVWARIKVNTATITSKLERIINHDFTNLSIPTIPVSLKKDDIIKMELDYTSSIGNPSIRSGKNTSFLSVVKI